MGRDISTAVFILGLAVLLIGLAMFLPDNEITGKVVDCPDCVALCESDDQCVGGRVCCGTHWDSGVCGYANECEDVREYSLYQSLDLYEDTVRNKPPAVFAGWGPFFLPMLIVLSIVVYFVWKRNNHSL